MNPYPLAGFLCAALTAMSAAATSTDLPIAPAANPDWEFRASMYGWLTGLDGSTGVGGLTSNLDVGFPDIVDDLKMASALQFEARHDKWGILADGFYVALGNSGSTPGPFYDSAGLHMKQFIGELSLAYRVHDSPSGFVDLYAGMRYNNLSVDFEGELD